jgi:hypothetical protein
MLRPLALLLTACALAGCGAAMAADDDDNLYWLDNYAEALRQSKATGKPIFLEYRCEP